jgi:two-component sensor histidine kinase
VRLEVLDSGPGLPQELIAETDGTIAGRPADRPARQVGFGLRLAGRLVRLLGASLKFAASPHGTSCQLALPDLAAGDRPVVEAASA